MSDEAPPIAERSAGAMLRAAREKQGMHIAVLAASIKVTRPKLEALEADRYEELPDMTFTRALAQAVCRALKIEAEPVLARLPKSEDRRIEQLGGGLNAPFRERPGRLEPSEGTLLGKPAFWVVAAVLVATAVLYLIPDSIWSRWRDRTAPAAPASAAASRAAAGPGSAPGAMTASSPVMVETLHAAPTVAASEPAAAPAGVAVLRASGESWIEVQDGKGQMLLSRTLQAGEAVGIDGVTPLRVTIGNVGATQVLFRGQPVDLLPATRDNVARVELK